MPVVVVEPNDAGVVHCIVNTERSGAEITRGRIIFDRLVEFVLVTAWIFEFRDPLSSCSVEDELQLVSVCLCELLRCLETVNEVAKIRVPFRSRQDYENYEEKALPFTAGMNPI